MWLDKFRSSQHYIWCGRIGVFSPLCLIPAKWCEMNGGAGYGPMLYGLMFYLPVLFAFGFFLVLFTGVAICNMNEDDFKPVETNKLADIGYIMYIIFMLLGIFMFFSL